MKNIILIPAYKPEQSFVDFSTELVSHSHTVVAVDDGGGETFAEIFKKVEDLGVIVLHHQVNKGKGAALRTGFKYIIDNMHEVNGVVTADCDGQHKIVDIERVMKEMDENPGKMVLGGRFADNVKVPIKSQIGNTLTRLIFRMATGLKIRDTQTGLRGIPQSLFQNMMEVKGDRYEYEMNMLLYLRDWECGFVEIPIETIYENNNAGSHYNPIKDSMRIFGQIFKFCLSSLASWVVDYGLFILFDLLLFKGAGLFGIFSIAYLLARVISSVVNYILNRHLVFKKGGKNSVYKYFALVIAVMLVGSSVTDLLQIANIPTIVCKIIIDVPLYVANYFIQRSWVFAKDKKGKK